jgi:hypothetical protein
MPSESATSILVSETSFAISFEVIGPLNVISEIGQPLAWLGATLRTSVTDHICRSGAQISSLSPPEFYIKFDVYPLEEDEGSCWHNIFANQVIAQGFPISSRRDEFGLEISLHMMAALGGASNAMNMRAASCSKDFQLCSCR